MRCMFCFLLMNLKICIFWRNQRSEISKGSIVTTISKVEGGFEIELISEVFQKDVFLETHNGWPF